ncbi:MAG: RNA-binding protein [Firmicutes bacterium]|jgi:large subunit ribosomal protein L14e|nr:RNA-binding protein [Bacillota bacterium]
MEELKPGQLVQSKAGRDKGSYYLVIKAAEPGRVLLADGRRRTLNRLKKKNIAHLQRIERRVEIEELIQAGKLTDSDVIKFLKELVPREDV